MKTPDDYSVSMAYSYNNSQELARYYDDSAVGYDNYAISVGYILPRLVAEKASRYLGNSDTVIDVGCGTGLLGVELNLIKDGLVLHGVDISQQMVSHAYRKKQKNGKRNYEKFFLSDMVDMETIEKNNYDLMVSSGTFTTGHLSGKDLLGMLGFMKSDSFAVFSVKSDHFEESGFLQELNNLKIKKLIEIIEILEVDSYENDGYTALSQIVSIKIN
jgi:predicted TPR repeat methyltransferase